MAVGSDFECRSGSDMSLAAVSPVPDACGKFALRNNNIGSGE